MGLYTNADIVRAVDYASDISKAVTAFCVLWRKHCNGYNEVKFPEDPLLIQVKEVTIDNKIRFNIVNLKTTTWEGHESIPIYDIGASEADGVDGIIDSYTHSWNEIHREFKTNSYTIGFRYLLTNPAELAVEFEALGKKMIEDNKRKQALSEIKNLERQIEKIKENM